MWHKRDTTGPVLAGDVTKEGTVAGFGYAPSSQPKATCDRLLLNGDETLAEPPDRPVPRAAVHPDRGVRHRRRRHRHRTATVRALLGRRPRHPRRARPSAAHPAERFLLTLTPKAYAGTGVHAVHPSQ
ncbi:hypothetical protein STRTUCAR8_01771 [Streptomyces turgidiscabies Car8]|uniref:Uncharacterized protein n=1 Tax=Streptomyces turgidiscabies (strain Car8) TaxID=698760 RepID=L7F2S4_STRT8|nr:hypothetical protein STRTUCAR8_01771 [Streptomyces turgidiscabies Car8]